MIFHNNNNNKEDELIYTKLDSLYFLNKNHKFFYED